MIFIYPTATPPSPLLDSTLLWPPGCTLLWGPLTTLGAAATTAVLCRVTNKSFQLSNFVSHSSHSAGSQAGTRQAFSEKQFETNFIAKVSSTWKMVQVPQKVALGACLSWCLLVSSATISRAYRSTQVSKGSIQKRTDRDKRRKEGKREKNRKRDTRYLQRTLKYTKL